MYHIIELFMTDEIFVAVI